MRRTWRGVTTATVARTLSKLLHTDVEVRLTHFNWYHLPACNMNHGPTNAPGIKIEGPTDRQPSDCVAISLRQPANDHTVVITAEPELLRTVGFCVTSRRHEMSIVSGGTSDMLRGAWAAILVELGRRLGLPVSVVEPGELRGTSVVDESLETSFSSLNSLQPDNAPPQNLSSRFPKLVLHTIVALAERSFAVDLELDAIDGASALVGHDAANPLKLGTLPICIPVVAAWSPIKADSLIGLGEGDVWLPGDGWQIDESLQGRAALIPPNSELGRWVDLAPNGKLVLRDDWAHVSMEAKVIDFNANSERQSDASGSLADVVADTVVVVRVELAAVTLPARRWGELLSGDILQLDKPVGAGVTLRVSNRAIAEGELVNIEGELGVRIRRILTNEATS